MSNIPEYKHSDQELADLRARSAMQTINTSIAAIYDKKSASKGMVIFGYTLPLMAPFWALVKASTQSKTYSLLDFWGMTIPILIALVIVLWIALKCVLSKHHAAFISIICLFCSFAIISAVNSDSSLKNKLIGAVGGEEAISTEAVESELDVNRSADMITEQERELIRAYEKEREDFLKLQILKKKAEAEAKEKAKLEAEQVVIPKAIPVEEIGTDLAPEPINPGQ